MEDPCGRWNKKYETDLDGLRGPLDLHLGKAVFLFAVGSCKTA